MSPQRSEVMALEAKAVSGSSIAVKQSYSEMDLKKTKRRGGTSGELGVMYEKKLLMLGLHRAINAKYDFTLDTNIEDVGAFDDVVFTYKEKDGIERRIYLQAKHKESKDKKIHYDDFLKSGNDDYALYKYFIDYIYTVRKFDDEGKINSKYFIIYTNIGFQRQSKGVESKRVDDREFRIQKAKSKDDYFTFKKVDLSSHRPLEVFSTVDSFYQFTDKGKNDEDENARVIKVLKCKFKSIDEKQKHPKLAAIGEDELDFKLKHFLKALILAVDQHGEKKLGNEIKKEIKQTLNHVSQDHVDFIFEYALNEIGQWKCRSKAKPLTKRDNFFEEGDKKFKRFPALYPTLVYKNEFSTSNIRFKREKFEELNNLISLKNKFWLISTKTPWLNSLLFYQALNEETLKDVRDYANNDHYLCLTWSDLLKGYDIILPAFERMEQSLVIIMCESKDTLNLKTAEIVGNMVNIVTASDNKVIIIAPENSELSKQMNQASIPHHNTMLKIEFDDLTTKSQEACLTMKKIRFRGREQQFNIQQLLGIEDKTKPNLNMSELELLLKNPTVEIGNAQHTLCHLESAHYKTHTHIQSEQLNNILKENPMDIFAFVGEEIEVKSILPSDVQQALILFEDGLMPIIGDFILLKAGQEDEQYKQLCYQVETNLEKPVVHLLRKNRDAWEWIRTYSPDFYMERNFYPLTVDKNKMRNELLKGYNMSALEREELYSIEFFVFSGTSEESFYKLLKIHRMDEKNHIRNNAAVFLDEESAEEKFDCLCKSSSQDGKSIHWLKLNEVKGQIQFQWYRSQGKLNSLRLLLVNEGVENTLFTEASFIKCMDRMVILADEPGMGKTTTLTHMGQLMQKENLFSWVIKTDLNRHQNVLASKQMETLKDLVNLLSRIDEKLDNPLTHCILLHQLICPGHVVLLWDGFDEVKSDTQGSILRLFMFLKMKTAATVWITTRRNDQKKLEDYLSVLAHPFTPLDVTKQIDYLSRFWATTLKLISPIPYESVLKSYAKKVINAFEQSIQTYETDNFISIPLRARMLAEIYQENVERSLENKECFTEVFNGNEKLSIGDIYQKFIAIKYNIYLSEKTRVGEGPDEESRRTLMRSYSKAYGILAVKILFDPFFIKYKIIKYTLNTLSRIGLIQGNEEPVNFIHRTFAEYFASEWLAKQANNSQVKTFLRVELFKKESEIIRRFFDYFITQDLQLHRAVLNGDVLALHESLKSHENSDIEITDDLGRTALHLAAQEGRHEMFQLLHNPKTDKISRDNGGRTALHYAACFGHDAVINKLLENYINIDLDDHIFRTPMHFVSAIRQRFFYKPKYAKIVELVNERDEAGKIPLNYAADNEHWNTACILLLYFANDSVLTEEQKGKPLDFAYENTGKVESKFLEKNNRLVPTVCFLANLPIPGYVPGSTDNKYMIFLRFLNDQAIDTYKQVFDTLLRIIMNKETRRNETGLLVSSHTSLSRVNSSNEYFFSDREYLKVVRYFFELIRKHKRDISLECISDFLSIAANHDFLDTSKYLYDLGLLILHEIKISRTSEKVERPKVEKTMSIAFFSNLRDLKNHNPWLENFMSIHYQVFIWTPLHFAAMNKHVNSIDDFLDPPVFENINCKDDIGNTPLACAAKIPGRSKFIESLFEALKIRNLNDKNQLYAIVNAKNYSGETPLYHVIREGHFDSAKVLLKSIDDIGFHQKRLFRIVYSHHSKNKNPFSYWRQWEDYGCLKEFIELLFKYIRFFNFSSQQCWKLLKGSSEIFRDLVEVGPVEGALTFLNCIKNLPFDDRDRRLIVWSSTLLHSAANRHWQDTILCLLKIGVIFNAYDSDHKTPLDILIGGKLREGESYEKTYFLLSSVKRLFELTADEKIVQDDEKLDELKETLSDLKKETWIDPESILKARNRVGKTLLDLSKYQEVTHLLQDIRGDFK